MSTLFSRRPGKSKLGFGSSTSSKHNKFGAGISSTDFEQLQDSDNVSLLLQQASQPSHSGLGSSHNDRVLPENVSDSLPALNLEVRPSSVASQLPFKSLPAHPTYELAADDFGRLALSHSKSRNGPLRGGSPAKTTPTQRPSPKWAAHSSSRLPSELGPLPAGANATASASGKEAYPYGYTHEGWDVEMTQSVARQIVEICGGEIRARGLDSPLIFSSMALDLSANGVASLIRAFIASDQTRLKSSPLADEVRYANPHDLAAMIKWTLARLGRFYAVPVPSPAPTKKGEVQEEMAVVQQRGWLELDWYMMWREHEKGSGYPWTAFSQFCHTIDDEAAQLLRSIFSLLSSTTSYSLKNGMTPSKLSRLFGALLFGLPEDETFTRTYESYLRASNATEHLFLAYIRDLAAYEVLPVRLMSHVDGYPAVLSSDLNRLARHVRTVPITQVERFVRFYSQDLIQSACEWDLAVSCDEWAACCSANEHHAKDPQLSDRFRQLIHLRGTPAQGRALRRGNSLTSDEAIRGRSHSARGQAQSEDTAAYTSVVDEQWDTFRNEGFAPPDKAKLAFDLRETERKARTQKRGTLAWSDFQALGFDSHGQDGALSAVLSFDDGLKEDMKRWPDERAELLERLRTTSAKAPPFPYDGVPRLLAKPSSDVVQHTAIADSGQTVFIRMDDVFAEVWADYLIGNGWSNRDEPTHRAANFVVLQFKSRPHQFTVGSPNAGSPAAAGASLPSRASLGDAVVADDRNDAAWFVVQEIVPSGYRADLEAAGRSSKNRTRGAVRKVKLFSRLRKDRALVNTNSTDKAANWSNDKENEALFPPGTKKLALNPDPATMPEPSFELERPGTAKGSRRGMVSLFSSPLIGSPDSLVDEPSHHNSTAGFGGLMTSLRGKARKIGAGTVASGGEEAPGVPLKFSLGISGGIQTNGQTGGFKTTSSSFGSSDFETRSLHDPEDETAASSRARQQKFGKRRRSLLRNHGRNESKDDAWIDVMMRNDTKLHSSDVPLVPARPERSSSLVRTSSPRDGPEKHASSDTAGAISGTGAEDDDDDATDFTPVTTPRQEAPSQLGPSPATSPRPPSTPGTMTSGKDSQSPAHTPVIGAAQSVSPTARGRRKLPAGEQMSSPPPPVQRASSPSTITAPLTGTSDAGRFSPLRSSGAEDVEMLAAATSSTQPIRPFSASATSYDTSKDIDAFPAPPTRSTAETSDIVNPDRNSVVSTASSEAVETIEFQLPSRTALRPVGDASKPERDQRVSAALNRARELRAKFQPVDGRGGGAAPDSLMPQTAAGPLNEEVSKSALGKSKIDPFAKDPTTGKVASIAAKFKEPDGSTGKGSSLAMQFKPTASKIPLAYTPVRRIPAPAFDDNEAASSSSVPNTSPLTRAALARVEGNGNLLDPDMPPSPRPSESAYGGADNESLAPDDAASNYSRSTEDSIGGEMLQYHQQQLMQPSTSAGSIRGWDKSSQAEHARQQALQTSFLSEGKALMAAASAATPAAGGRSEEEDITTDLPTHFAEPYRPGQPLENLLEESESMLSGSNV